MKILITGFDPFGGESVNPACEAVKLLPDTIAEAEIIKLQVPTRFALSGTVLEAAVNEHRPDAVICVGQAGGRSAITPERVAINLADASIPDNAGDQPVDEPIRKDGAPAYFTSLPVKAMVQKMRAAGIPAALSYTAGSFVCNSLMYTLLYLIDRQYPAMRGGFIHVPYAMEQAVGKPLGTPSMGSAPNRARHPAAGVRAGACRSALAQIFRVGVDDLCQHGGLFCGVQPVPEPDCGRQEPQRCIVPRLLVCIVQV